MYQRTSHRTQTLAAFTSMPLFAPEGGIGPGSPIASARSPDLCITPGAGQRARGKPISSRKWGKSSYREGSGGTCCRAGWGAKLRARGRESRRGGGFDPCGHNEIPRTRRLWPVCLYETGLSFGRRQRQGKLDALKRDELGARDLLFTPGIAGVFENLLQAPDSFCFLQKTGEPLPGGYESHFPCCRRRRRRPTPKHATKVRPSLKMRAVN